MKYDPYRICDDIVLVEEHQRLNFSGGCCFKLGIATVNELQSWRDQCHAIYPVRIINERTQDILYHICVTLHTCRGSAAEDEEQILLLLIIQDCVAAVSWIVFLLKFLFNTFLAVVLFSLEGWLLPQLTVEMFLFHINDTRKITSENFHKQILAAFVF